MQIQFHLGKPSLINGRRLRRACSFRRVFSVSGLLLLAGGIALVRPAGAQVPDLGIGASLHGKPVLPADNSWNRDISQDPVDPNSAALLASIGLATGLHPDFGAPYNGVPNGIPYVVVSKTQARVPVTFDYVEDSDPGPYPIPSTAPIEGGPSGTGDRHVLVLDRDNWALYELWRAFPNAGYSSWSAGGGAIFPLNSNTPRPQGLSSADAAGLPIFPGLVRYDEVAVQGAILHALRFTVQRTRRGFVYPARHYASTLTDPTLPPMGMRVRLKASVDISRFPASVQVILTALKRYGMFVADNGSNWFLSGAPDDRWNDTDLHTLGLVHGSDFEVVTMEPVTTDSVNIPTNVQAQASNGSVSLTWTATAGATSYRVKRSTAPGGPYALLASGVTATSGTDTTVVNGTTYYYVVSAVNADMQSFDSLETSATPTAPFTPQTLLPLADAYVRAGLWKSDMNFGTATSLFVDNAVSNSTSTDNRCAYLQFDLTRLSSAPSRATLTLTNSGGIPWGSVGTLNLYAIPSASWTETGLTWNNAPGLNRTNFSSTGTLLGTQSVTLAGGTTSFDVTAYIASHCGQVVTFQLLDPLVESKTFYLNSKEAATGKPQLILK